MHPHDKTNVFREYSKSSEGYTSAKHDYFEKNSELLDAAIWKNQLYSQQPRREVCKICSGTLPDSIDFVSHGINYIFCPHCTHLNGQFEDTKEFVSKLYINDDAGDYTRCYIDSDFKSRCKNVYAPKLDFLLKHIPQAKRKILDVGCGGGYFVYAALLKGVEATGLDINQPIVEFGNKMLSSLIGVEPLICGDETFFFDTIRETKADVISAIGVIEHLRNPNLFFEAFKKSKAKYLYYSVPMFSFSVILEILFDDIFPRQLSGGHTHLFTEHSIKKLNFLSSVEPLAEWRFGTDIMDLYRTFGLALKNKNVSEKALSIFENNFKTRIDALQSVLDVGHFCSEIHCITQKV